jgi:hypothetical protein
MFIIRNLSLYIHADRKELSSWIVAETKLKGTVLTVTPSFAASTHSTHSNVHIGYIH